MPHCATAGPCDAACSSCSPGGFRPGGATASSPAPGGCSSCSSDFRFGADRARLAAREKVVSAEHARLARGRSASRGRIRGYREGELYFPGSPLLVVEGTFAEAVVLETLALSVLNYDSAVASAAARMVSAADGRPLAEMGSRRTGERSAVAAARAAYIAGFAATSNLEAGRTWGVPTMGTAAHSFTLLHDTEEEAFAAQVAAMGAGTTLLVDTYDITEGVATAVRVAGTELGAVRIDSGDLGVVVREVRAQLDALGATKTRITVTNDLDEYAIASLRSAPVDSYGVGTSLVTGSGAPAAGHGLQARRAPGRRRRAGCRSARPPRARRRSAGASSRCARSRDGVAHVGGHLGRGPARRRRRRPCRCSSTSGRRRAAARRISGRTG